MIRVGNVSAINAARMAVRVVFRDQQGIVTNWLPIITQSGAYWMPKVNDPVVCIFLGNGIESGFCVGSYYPNAAPAGDAGKVGTWYPDGSYIEYSGGQYTINMKSKVIITGAAGVEILGETTINGDVRITGDLVVDGGITRGGESI